MDTAALISLVLSALVAEDALTARDLADRTGIAPAALRPVLRQLVADGAIATSGRASGTRYVLAIEEQAEQLPACAVAMQCFCAGHAGGLPFDAACDTREQWYVAPAVPAAARRPARARKARRAIPATLDLAAALEATAEKLAAGQTLAELSARPSRSPQPAPQPAESAMWCSRCSPSCRRSGASEPCRSPARGAW